MNPRAILVMWTLTILMAAAIALCQLYGPLYIFIVGGLIIAYTMYAIIPPRRRPRRVHPLFSPSS